MSSAFSSFFFVVLGFVSGLLLLFVIWQYSSRLFSYAAVIIATSLTFYAIGFSTNFSVKTTLLYDSRQADMNALHLAISSKEEGNETKGLMVRNWLIVSEDYRRLSRVRSHSAKLLSFAILSSGISLFVLILSGGLLWVILFWTGFLFS